MKTMIFLHWRWRRRRSRARPLPRRRAFVQPLAGTRLDVTATGEVTRVPDLAIISAGVQTLQPTATAAIEENATRMERVRAALKRAGIADNDIQTSSISLNPEYRYVENQPPVLTGYRASNTVNVKFRDSEAQRDDPRCVGQGRRQPDQRAKPDDRQARSGL